MSSAAKIRIGVDLGGTKIEAVALARDGSIAFRHRVATPADPYENTVKAIAGLVKEAETATGTLCMRSERFCAVTTISATPLVAVLSASVSAADWACAGAARQKAIVARHAPAAKRMLISGPPPTVSGNFCFLD